MAVRRAYKGADVQSKGGEVGAAFSRPERDTLAQSAASHARVSGGSVARRVVLRNGLDGDDGYERGC